MFACYTYIRFSSKLVSKTTKFSFVGIGSSILQRKQIYSTEIVFKMEAKTVESNGRKPTTLRLSDYDAFGFDIDHTLAKYNIPKLFDQIHFSLTSYLVDKKGYAKSLAEPLDADFLMRGIVLDVSKGNFLKLAEDGTILRASHGTKFMSFTDIQTTYGEDRHWPMFEKLIENVNNLGNEFRIFENFFDMPIMMAAARLVDILNEDGEKPETYGVFWSDLSEAIEDTYDPRHFSLERGHFFPEFKRDTDQFLHPCDHDVKAWLKNLKDSGKVVFLATSSYNDFALTALKYVLGEQWNDYFDYVFTFARKPGFFKTKRDFLRVENSKEKEAVKEIEPRTVYSQGNSEVFMKKLRETSGKSDPNVLFFGDSLRSDVFPGKVFGKWDTVLVLEEMVAEQHAFKAEAVVEPEGKRIKLSEPSDKEKQYLTSHQWGSFFTDDHAPNTIKKNAKDDDDAIYMNTLWGFIVRKYADIAIPQLEYIADLKPDHEFKVFNHEIPRDWGFYPGLPSALQKKTERV